MNKSKLIIPILLASLAAMSEYLHLLFIGQVHSEVVNGVGNYYNIYLDDAVWYFINALFVLLLNTVILFLINKKNIAGKTIMTGVVFWFSIELFESFCFLAKINNNRIFINDGSVWQICTMLLVMFGSWYGLSRFKS